MFNLFQSKIVKREIYFHEDDYCQQELLPRLKSIELAGPVERIRSDFVNGIKRMPVRVVTA